MSSPGNGAPASREPVWISVLGRVYAGALWLYPPSHRRRWGPDMRLAFRDRCREAARAGRGPWRVLFTELLPDLAATVGAEHVDTLYMETHPMKRLLLVLIVVLFAALVWRPDFTWAFEAVNGWNVHRHTLAANRAFSSYYEQVAQTVEQQRRDSHDDVMAAILYWAAAQDQYGERNGKDSEAIGPAAAESFRDRADAAFARALRVEDRWALWLAVRDCPARVKVCQPEHALARLEQLDANNGAVWMLDLAAALKRGDAARNQFALDRIAHSTLYDAQSRQIARAVLDAFDRVPVPASVRVDPWERADYMADPAASMAQDLISSVSTSDLLVGYSELQSFSHYCHSTDVQTFAARRVDCRAAAKLIVDQAHLHFGYITWIRNADPGELDAAREAYRVHVWRNWGYIQYLDPASQSRAVSLAMWRENLLHGDQPPSVAMHMPAQPPASYQLSPYEYDPPND